MSQTEFSLAEILESLEERERKLVESFSALPARHREAVLIMVSGGTLEDAMGRTGLSEVELQSLRDHWVPRLLKAGPLVQAYAELVHAIPMAARSMAEIAARGNSERARLEASKEILEIARVLTKHEKHGQRVFVFNVPVPRGFLTDEASREKTKETGEVVNGEYKETEEGGDKPAQNDTA